MTEVAVEQARRWERALSPDGGVTWETNWYMDFERVTD